MAVRIPLLHIADATAEEVKQAGLATVGLLGTRFTMEEELYKERLHKRYGLQARVPNHRDRDIVHRVVFEGLCLGKVIPESRVEYRRVIADLAGQGAEIHARKAAELALSAG